MSSLSRTTVFASAAMAAITLAAAAPAEAQDDVNWSFSVTGATDYVWRGVSQTDRNPAAFVTGQATFANGFYVGAGAENVDFNEGTDAEYDVWAGWSGKVSDTLTLDVGAVRYGYIGAPDGTDYDTVELKAALTAAVGRATVTGSIYATDDFFGTDESAVYYEVAASTPVTAKWTVGGAVARQTVAASSGDYTTWNLGATYALTPKASFDLRYHDTDAHEFGDGFDSTLVAAIKFAF
ncbi:TorF family putative porin [Brevundimonas sp.]|uniref:TorF family putative porin n=1 Tax=Brevundimonas sp. TaxID=1871086 RepID=UPI002EDB4A54